ncbi:hypothetical protein PVAND_006391 [Polypedilum vanderplanki]|uniref:Uncharacterized protein n=1 Tax=Polypedilum vanderplanki TaxID=319348 RepID=A0A9J6C3H7_POLVA|nr:hypothetical protein PVAND_006391 [Polypedilum vanderplanki]
MQLITAIFSLLLVIQSARPLKIKCEQININTKTSFGKLKQCESQSDIFAITPNTTIDGVDAKEDLKNIKSLSIKNATSMHYFPGNIAKFFPNLKVLSVINSGLKVLTKNDLKPFTKLQGLYLENTSITALEGDLFKYCAKLEELVLTNSHLKYVENGTFKALTKLVMFQFSSPCYNKETINTTDEFEPIFEKIEESCNEKEVDDLMSLKIKIKCENFRVLNVTAFTMKECEVNHDINSTTRNVIIDKIEADESIANVGSFVMGYAKNLHYLPHGIAENFPKLKLLMIGDSGLKELKSENLKPLAKLEGLYLINTELTVIEGNLFKHSSNLKELVIKGHKLKYVEPGTFEPMTNTRFLIFKDNLCYDKTYIKDITDKEIRRREVYERCRKHEDEQKTVLIKKKSKSSG